VQHDGPQQNSASQRLAETYWHDIGGLCIATHSIQDDQQCLQRSADWVGRG